MRTLAATSIPHVHRAVLADGTDLAIKCTVPTYATTSTAIVGDVAMLLRRPARLPPDLALAPLLTEAKRQLHAEAARAIALQIAEFAASGDLLNRFLAAIQRLRAPPVPA